MNLRKSLLTVSAASLLALGLIGASAPHGNAEDTPPIGATVTLTTGYTPVQPGATLKITVTVTNTGSQPWTIGSYGVFESPSAMIWYMHAGGSDSKTSNGCSPTPIAVGQSCTITFPLALSADSQLLGLLLDLRLRLLFNPPSGPFVVAWGDFSIQVAKETSKTPWVSPASPVTFSVAGPPSSAATPSATPTPAATPSGWADYSLTDDKPPAPGQYVGLNANGFQPDELVHIIVYANSTPYELGWYNAEGDNAGFVGILFEVPTGFPGGQQRADFIGEVSGPLVTIPFTVAGGNPPGFSTDI